jgi:hypothetical protein
MPQVSDKLIFTHDNIIEELSLIQDSDIPSKLYTYTNEFCISI